MLRFAKKHISEEAVKTRCHFDVKPGSSSFLEMISSTVKATPSHFVLGHKTRPRNHKTRAPIRKAKI